MKLNVSKKMSIDEYFNDGVFEIIQQGTLTSIRSLMSSEQHKEITAKLSTEYEAKVLEIKGMVSKIRVEITQCDSLQLLKFAHNMFMISSINKVSEIEYDISEVVAMRGVEYIQSIIVSTPIQTNSDGQNESRFHLILKLIEDLYFLLNNFFFYWGAHAINELGYSDNLVKYIIEATKLGLVRGNRYQFQQKRLLEQLLIDQDALMTEVLQISHEQFIDGLVKLEYSLSSANADSLNGIMNLLDQWMVFMEQDPDDITQDLYREQNEDKNRKLLDELFGYALNDVSRITGWPDFFIKQLSYHIGEYNDFYNEKDFAGWPIDVQPVHRKPFVIIEGVSYCFDYYSLFDNIYRVIQKTIANLDNTKMNTWSNNQKNASERLVMHMFEKLLPNAVCYADNYYPKKESLKDMAENDLIVFYDGIILIVEVKAGSFTYTTPISDHVAHKKSFETLIEVADSQCMRTKEYILSRNTIKFYNQNRTEKVTFSKPKDIFTLSITVDNMNEFQAKAQNLSLIKIGSGSISVCIDDLDVYANYFDNPLKFIHYLYQRREAAKSEIFVFNDELDHLGMYIKHNMYNQYFTSDGNISLQAYGYREPLDRYLGMLHMDISNEFEIEKPEQNKHKYIEEILTFLNNSNTKNGTDLSNFLLDLSFEAREEFDKYISRIYKRQNEIGRMIIVTTYGEAPYNLYVFQPDVGVMSEKMRCDYVKSSVVMHKEESRLMINVHLDNNMDVVNVEFEFVGYEDICETEKEYLTLKALEYAKTRAAAMKHSVGVKKIGRNDSCPCGSGKKYKKCCIGKY